mgnify:CR=1 FL=1
MELLQALALGIVQGLTEFLPVSSSGHLILVREALGWKLLADPHLNKSFDVALHGGTFIALACYFWRDIGRLLRAWAASFRAGLGDEPERRLAWLVVIGAVPGAVAGLLGEDVIENRLGAPRLVAAQLIAFALLLWLAEARGRKERELAQAGWWDGVLIGLAQALALAPGVSRSGVTITAGLARGMTRETAARFSFLLSLPIVAGSAAYSLAGLVKDPGLLPPGSPALFGAGMVAAAVSGFLCIHYFLRYLQTRTLSPFVVYRVGLGLALLALFTAR